MKVQTALFFLVRGGNNDSTTVTPVSKVTKNHGTNPEHLWSCSTVGSVSPSAPTGDCMSGISCRARALANWDGNDLVSADMQPPTSMPKTTRRVSFAALSSLVRRTVAMESTDDGGVHCELQVTRVHTMLGGGQICRFGGHTGMCVTTEAVGVEVATSRKRCDGILVRKCVEVADKANPAPGPACNLTCALARAQTTKHFLPVLVLRLGRNHTLPTYVTSWLQCLRFNG